ncbi:MULTISPECIES: GNAT family N-acetyltransferase [Streptomyces]|uniref:Acetyltransferase n=2 Tax=Streptomyces TaxID=1883 RepID=A0A100Y4U5_9ACTN|nr:MULTISPECIES: GNAT family N-acetyltransferase [Streptomyces]KUH37722.1 acetyltransferase [Streptomyces kanasensis]UUS31830.1 GNAT family N-acetyltransferase [Streptomyces changanensis]
MTYAVRPVRAEEWREARELRLASLRDPLAHLAFLDTYEEAAARPDAHWRGRTERAAAGAGARQFVAVGPDGRWVGTVTALLERQGGDVLLGEPAEVDQTHLVGVYVRPGARGSGVAEALMRAAVRWSWSLREPVVRRVRLYVHERNARAAALYRKAGFRPSGAIISLERGPEPGEAGAVEVEYELLRSGASADVAEGAGAGA